MSEKGGGEDYVPKKKLQKTSRGHASVQFNCSLLSPDIKQSFKNNFLTRTNFHAKDIISLTNEPFPCAVVSNFIRDSEYLQSLKDELLDLRFHEKCNDLYKFHQSVDLKNVGMPYISALKKLLYQDFGAWLKDVMGIPLDETVDATCAMYSYTDVLLCHDDELEGRRIAFILYLVPPSWCDEDGGSLDLFAVDDDGQPSEVVTKLLPAWNTLVFFEVSSVSFHQVAEILSKDKCRLSISGWFHGPTFERPPPHIEALPDSTCAGHVTEELLREWVNPMYLKEDIQMQIQQKFQNDSEIELCDIFQESKYHSLCEELQNASIKWSLKGPANKRHYEEAEAATYPGVFKECLEMMQSEAMFLILSNLTGLKLHKLAAEDDASDNEEREGEATCRAQLRRWTHGCYTLIHDEDTETTEFALDAVVFFNCPDWKSDYGGRTSYIAKGEDEELLTVIPAPNSLALVYRDQETLKFVKHVNHHVSERSSSARFFQDLSMVFYE